MKNTLIHHTYNLFLDDYRQPIEAHVYMFKYVYLIYDWVVVENYNEFVDYVTKNGMPKCVSFDHDLADVHYNQQENPDYCDNSTEKTGYHCAKWLIDYAIDNEIELPKEIYVHSMNNVGARNIRSLFETFYKIYGNERK